MKYMEYFILCAMLENVIGHGVPDNTCWGMNRVDKRIWLIDEVVF